MKEPGKPERKLKYSKVIFDRENYGAAKFHHDKSGQGQESAK